MKCICTLATLPENLDGITDEYAAMLNDYFKLEQPLSAGRFGEILDVFPEHNRSVLLLHICEGMSLTEISAISNSNVMRIKQVFDKAERMMNYKIQNVSKKQIRDYLDKTEDNV